ncbi:MAG TPA: carboxypeptidase-like regulatory domain-containing protein [bacterium]|nr:carboxypeptidase-like regulatory domain-containing protein [bacterium]
MKPRQVRSGFLIAGAILFTAVAESAQAGILTGKVTNPNNVGVANVKVDFFESSTGNPIVVTGNLTDAGGNYGVLVPNGTYDVEFVTPVAPGGIVPARYTAVTINTTVTLNVSRPFGKVLDGTVFDTLGAAVPNVDLNVIDALTGTLEFTPNDNTDASGNYGVMIAPGLKNIVYADQNAGSRLAARSLTNVNIVNDSTIDVSLPAGVFVNGTVWDGFSQPVTGADLDFDDAATKTRLTTPSDNTDNNGDYIVTVPRGTYDITVEPDVADRLVAERRFSIPVNKDTTIDFTLQAGLSLSGSVSGPGGAVASCDIDVIDAGTRAKLVTPGDRTDGAGFYEVIVPVGNYEMHFQPPVATHLASVIKTGIHVAMDTIVNAAVPAGVILSGHIQSGTGANVDACDIDVFLSSTGATVLASGDKSNFFGNYEMVVVGNTYDLEFEAPKTRRLQAKRFTSVAVTSNVNFPVTLDTGLSVSGTVTGGGTPIDSVNVDAILQSSGVSTFQPGDRTDAAGFYQIIIGFVPHTLVFFPPVASGYAAKSFTNINPGGDHTLNVALGTGFLVTGTVTQTGGAPVSGATLRAESGPTWVPTTDGVSRADGYYETLIPGGTYTLRFIRATGPTADTVVLSSVAIARDTVINVEFSAAACTCPCKYDPACDGVISNVQDVVTTVNVAFRGASGIIDPGCGIERTDVDGNGFTSVTDVVRIVNVAFRGADRLTQYVDPCP